MTENEKVTIDELIDFMYNVMDDSDEEAIPYVKEVIQALEDMQKLKELGECYVIPKKGTFEINGINVHTAVKELEHYRAYKEIFESHFSKDTLELLSDKEEFGEWLERGKWIAKKCDEINRELEQYRAIGTVEKLQKSVNEEDVLKFYYIESEDKYVVGKRVDNFYYAEVGKTGLSFYMSRYLPFGEHVVAPDTLWKEHTYPSEPKEIPFFDWLQGFMKKEYGGTIEEFKALKEKNNKDFELLLKAVKESYPMFKDAYVELDVFMGDVMRRFTRDRKQS